MGNNYQLLTINALLLINLVNCYHTVATNVQGNVGNASRLSEATNVSCRDPNGVEGVCKNIKQCPAVLRDFVRLVERRDAAYLRYIRQSNAICHGMNNPTICCPRETKLFGITKSSNKGTRGRLPTPEEGCGLGKPIPRLKVIYPGFKTEPGVYPWIALIGYANSEKPHRECVGSLITSRHVLTSAHCVNSALTFVRLGVFDINSVYDENVQDVRVIRSERHPDYNKRDRLNDIAILYLERDVNFTDRIRPICLPVSEPIRSRDFVHYTPFIAAWSRIQNAHQSSNHSPNVMRDWQLLILNNAECKEQYKRQRKFISEEQFGDEVICAQVIDGGRMKCQRDSGLMQPIFNHKMRTFSYYLTGIPSYGVGCQAANTPPVYTRVQNFIDWIQEKVGL